MNEKQQLIQYEDGQTFIHREKAQRPQTWFKWDGPEQHIPEINKTGRPWVSQDYYGLLLREPASGNLPDHFILSISARDETAKHDWRNFQELKNLIVGEEWEGLELYPAESRLTDPSNRYYLWCFPKGFVTWGFQQRKVYDMHEAMMAQRPFPDR